MDKETLQKFMFGDYQNIHAYAKRHLIEQIMTLVGRGLRRARDYRSELEAMSLAEVRRERELIANEMKGEQ